MATTKELANEAATYRKEMESVLRLYFKEHPTEIFEIAERCGFTPQEAEFIIYNSSVKFDKLLSLYGVFKTVVAEKSQSGIQKHF